VQDLRAAGNPRHHTVGRGQGPAGYHLHHDRCLLRHVGAAGQTEEVEWPHLRRLFFIYLERITHKHYNFSKGGLGLYERNLSKIAKIPNQALHGFVQF